MAYDNILLEAGDGVALLRLNRPQALNALNDGLMRDVIDALAALAADDGVGCVVITGSDRAFAAGADIKEMAEKSYAEMFKLNLFAPLADAIGAFRKPIIAAVSGFALGGGCELAMLCDFIIASETARFGQPEITLGVAPGIGGSQRLTRFVGKSKAMDMILTGRRMDAAEAERSGLVSRVVPVEALVEEAMAAARKIAALSPLAAMINKEMVNQAYETTLSAGVAFERRLFHSLFAFEDQKEGMAAFVEKRPASFVGR
jgi:enoyl-CoA hydratase/carnithine racemase